MPSRRRDDWRDRAPAREGEGAAAARARPQGALAQLLALQASVGNAAVARAIAAGQLGVSREGDGGLYGGDIGGGASAYQVDEAFDERGDESMSEDPQARLVRAVSERIAEKGKAVETPAASPDPYAGHEDGLANPYGYQVSDVSEDELSEDLPAAPPPLAGSAAAAAASQPNLYDPYVVSEDQASELSSDDVSEDLPAAGSAASAAASQPNLYDPYVVSEDEGISAHDESASVSAPPLPATLPALEAPALPTTPAPALPGKKAGKARRALKALAKPFKAVGSAIKKALKGRGKKSAPPTAAELLADPTEEVEAAPAAAAALYEPYKAYTPYAPSTSASAPAVPYTPAARVQHPLLADASISISEDAPPPPAMKYGNLAKMGMSDKEQHSSAGFLNVDLLGAGMLAVDMQRFGLVKPGEDRMAVQADPARAREGLMKAWGWSAEDVAKYYDSTKVRVKGTKVDYIKSEEDLKKFVVRPGATLQYGDPPQPFDTSGMLSKASGPGFAIFVMDGQGNIYAGQHRVGLFHHSSFLAGRDVAAAGEMKVSGGTLVELTSKSGHYAPDPDQMHQMLVELSGHGLPLAGVKVKLWVQHGKTYVTNYYDAAEFLAKKTGATPIGGGHMWQ